MTKTYNCSVINKYLIVGKHLLTTFLVILNFNDTKFFLNMYLKGLLLKNYVN
jgi:hypothetical protein